MKQDKALNVMQVLPSLVSGGVETGTIDIARALIEAGHRATVMSSGGQMVSMLTEMGAKHITLPVQSKNPFVMWKNAQAIKEVIHSEGISLVHARSRAPAWSCYWATQKVKTPYVTTFHGTYGHKSRLKRWYNSIMLKSDLTIAVSNFIASHINDTYSDFTQNPTKPNKVQVIHRGIDIHKFDPEKVPLAHVAKLRTKWNIAEENIVIMLPGRITRWKGHTYLIEALAKTKQTNITCVMVGDNKGKDNYQDELISLIKLHKLENMIKIVGGCNDMPAAYGLADIVVSASTDPEAFGRIACEAQAMQCLVIATQHGGSLETISPPQQHLMCKVADSRSMAESIHEAIVLCSEQHAKTKKLITDVSRKHIQQNFTLELMCRDTLALYRQVIKNKGSLS